MTVHLIGGAPRTGKTMLAQQVAAKLSAGWVSTDMVLAVLRAKVAPGVKTSWNASPTAINGAADWFYPALEQLVFGASSLADAYVIEGVDFLPGHVSRLSESYPVQAVFLGRSAMTLEQFDAFPGRSPGYASLPDETRAAYAADISYWSEFVRAEAAAHNMPYIDTTEDFNARLMGAEATLLGSRST